MNDRVFFDIIRASLFSGKLTPTHISGMCALLDAFDLHGIKSRRQKAYMLATAKWETAHTMKPIREYGKGRGRRYGKPDPDTGQTYFGRGFVQLTWKSNYQKMGKLLDIDLVRHPDLALESGIAADILVIGMRDGMFAPAAGPLSNFLDEMNADWWNARRTVNGLDKNKEIAVIAQKFDAALAEAEKSVPETQPPEPVKWWVTLYTFLLNLWRKK